MLKLFLYGYLNRLRSSRRLVQERGRNLELMWLLTKRGQTLTGYNVQAVVVVPTSSSSNMRSPTTATTLANCCRWSSRPSPTCNWKSPHRRPRHPRTPRPAALTTPSPRRPPWTPPRSITTPRPRLPPRASSPMPATTPSPTSPPAKPWDCVWMCSSPGKRARPNATDAIPGRSSPMMRPPTATTAPRDTPSPPRVVPAPRTACYASATAAIPSTVRAVGNGRPVCPSRPHAGRSFAPSTPPPSRGIAPT